MKAVIAILTTALAMTALAVPYQNTTDIKSAGRNTTLVPTPTSKLLPPTQSVERNTTLVPTPTSKLLPPTEVAEMVRIHSSEKAVATVTPVLNASSHSPLASNSTAEDKDGKKKIHIIGSLMNSLGLDGFMGSLSSLMTAE